VAGQQNSPASGFWRRTPDGDISFVLSVKSGEYPYFSIKTNTLSFNLFCRGKWVAQRTKKSCNAAMAVQEFVQRDAIWHWKNSAATCICPLSPPPSSFGVD
jgi:hypothetical protein